MKAQSLIVICGLVLVAGCRGSVPIPISFPGGTIGPGQICFEVPEEGSSFDRAFRAKCGVGVRVTIGGSASSKLVEMGGASNLALNRSRSNLPVPAGAPLTVRVRDANETLLAQRSFVTTVASGRVKAANPYEVDAWINSVGPAAVVADLEFGPFEVTQNDGENRMIFDARVGSVVVASQGRIWYLNKCDLAGTTGECNYQEP